MIYLSPPFCMAPMAGVTDAAFRARLRRNGCARLSTEMISAAALARKNPKTAEYLRVPDPGQDLSVQLFGADPEELGEAALTAQEAGFQAVDFNMGCPVRKVVRSGAGAALLRDTDRARRCLEALRRAVRGKLSVKIRSGWDSASINCLEVGRLAADCGVDAVTLHPRSRAQGYSGQADWTWVGRLARSVPIPVVGNGDVTTASLAVRRLRECGCSGVMIGRGALSEPWIFRDAADLLAGRRARPAPAPRRIGEDVLAQLDDGLRWRGERVAVFEMRKFLAWASRGLRDAAEFRRKIQRIREVEALRDEVRRFFSTTVRLGSGGEGCSEDAGHEWEERDAGFGGAA